MLLSKFSDTREVYEYTRTELIAALKVTSLTVCEARPIDLGAHPKCYTGRYLHLSHHLFYARLRQDHSGFNVIATEILILPDINGDVK